MRVDGTAQPTPPDRGSGRGNVTGANPVPLIGGFKPVELNGFKPIEFDGIKKERPWRND